MKKKIFIAVFFAIMFFNAKAQLKDVTFTVSPMVEHTWWNNYLTLDNSTFWGGRVGFGFGPLFEIRGFYQKSFDVQASLRELNWQVTDDWADKMTNSHIDIVRYGGELKFNLMKNRIFAPFITIGGGVQELSYGLPSVDDPLVPVDLKEEQLFGAVGLGTKFNLSDRIVLTLEAKNNFFNVSDKSYYLSPDYAFKENGNDRIHNWAAVASLDFYLGGVKTDDNEVSRAYNQLFSDGFKGMKFVLEPGGTYVNFHENSLFDDQFFLGASAGVDFSSLVGIRGFYYQATEDPDKPSFNFNNNLAMYGGNIIARLNQPRGVNPYLSLGAGYLKVKDGYVGSLPLVAPESSPFALGGIGLEIPLSKYAALYGSANAMFSSEKGTDIVDVLEPSQIKTSIMYQAGVRFNLGRKADADAIYSEATNRAVMEERDYNNEQINQIRAEYQDQIASLNAELDSVTRTQDFTRAAEIMKEKQIVESSLQNLDAVTVDGNTLIRMTEEDFDRIVSNVVRETRREAYGYYNQTPAQETSQQLTNRLNELEQKLDRNFLQMNQINNNPSRTTVITDRNNRSQVISPQSGVVATRGAGSGFFKWNRLGVFSGLGFGDLSTWNIGARGYLQIGNTEMDFVPEFYVAVGDKSGVGLSGNVVYNLLQPGSFLRPYAGLGLGIFHGEKVHYGTNIILGADIRLFGGSLFADYSSRSWFKQNQVAIGYRFVF